MAEWPGLFLSLCDVMLCSACADLSYVLIVFSSCADLDYLLSVFSCADLCYVLIVFSSSADLGYLLSVFSSCADLCYVLSVFPSCADLRQELAVQQKQERRPTLTLAKDPESLPRALSSLPPGLGTPAAPPRSPVSTFAPPASSFQRGESTTGFTAHRGEESITTCFPGFHFFM